MAIACQGKNCPNVLEKTDARLSDDVTAWKGGWWVKRGAHGAVFCPDHKAEFNAELDQLIQQAFGKVKGQAAAAQDRKP